MSLSIKLCQFIWQQKSIPQRIARMAYKRMAKKGMAPDHAFTTNFFGLTYEGNLSNNIDFNIFYYGAFEKPLLFFLRDTISRLAPDRPVFIDIGANVGQHSLFMAAHGCQVHAFEPFDRVRERLQLQVSNNRLANVQIHAVGLSNENTRLPFFAPTGRNVGIGSFDASTRNKGNVSIGELELVRGDDYFSQHDIAAMNLMKIDVEGFEKPALAGLQKTLHAARPVVVCEITYGKPLSFTSVEELLAHLPADYTLLAFDKRKEDGSKARRRDARSRYTGDYRIIPYRGMLASGQDDVIACPNDKLESLPRVNP